MKFVHLVSDNGEDTVRIKADDDLTVYRVQKTHVTHRATQRDRRRAPGRGRVCGGGGAPERYAV